MREYELEVLEQYDLEVISTRKIRGAFFCDTNEGTMLLKETKISDRRALLLYLLLCHMENDRKVDTPVFTKEKALIGTSRDGTRYMLKKWYGGRECDVRREADILAAGSNLAHLHRNMCWQESCGLHEGEILKPPLGRHLKEEFLCHNRELKKVRSFIRNKVSKGKFEYLFLEHFEQMYALAERVTDRLAESEYEALYRDSVENGRLVHGDYNYHNVLLQPEGIATVNFEHFRIDVQVQDLYYFLRKVMEKHRWDADFGEAILESYDRVRPLEQREREYIALKLAYPEKFWKTANLYYHSNKAWVSEMSVEKLQLSIQQTEEKMRFLEKIFTFIL